MVTYRRLCCLMLAVLAAAMGFSQPQVQHPTQVISPLYHDTSLPLGVLAANAPPLQAPTGPLREIPNKVSPFESTPPYMGVDPVLQNRFGGGASPMTISNFEGISDLCGCMPPDVNGAAGSANRFVETVNTHFAVYDKQGNQIQAPQLLGVLWTGFPGPWSGFLNDGDPVVLYDRYADRWVVMQFSLPSQSGTNYILFAVSTTSDPLGSYNRYGFTFTNIFPDYPKISVWRDGYYLDVADYANGASYVGDIAAVVERDSMLVGSTARMVTFLRSTSDPRFLPADADGGLPPAGTPNYFTGIRLSNASLYIYELAVNWSNPSSSTFTGPTILPAAAFTAPLCGGGRNCIKQLGTTAGLDAISDRLMFRTQWRNFGGYYTLVANHTVQISSSPVQSGIRWYELRKYGAAAWAIYQQGTYAPDANSRWMGSIAMDKFGNIGLGYSVSSSSMYPAIRFTGRKPGDVLGQMTVPETTIVAGGGSQSGGYRWGDYTSLHLDPLDDATFWYSGEYLQTTGSFNWRTRIASFKLLSDTSLAVTSPNGGESWAIGSSQNITWTSSGVTGNVKIDLSTDGGVTFPTTLFASTANDGSEPWTVTGPATTTARVRIMSVTNAAIRDSSNANFSIVQPTITVTSPNGGESWPLGSAQTILWSSANLTGNVRIDLSTNGGATFPTVISASTANTGSLPWTVSGAATPSARVRISSLSITSLADTSNANFTIVQPTVTVTSPNGGESWLVGSSQTITWTSTNLSGNVRLDLSTDGGATFPTVVSAGTANTGSLAWTVVGPATSSGRIRVTGVTVPTATDVSDGNFTIIQPTLTVTSPNGGESWAIGSSQTITWTSSNLPGNVKIDLSTDGGATFPTVISAATANTGSMPWTVAGAASSTARVRISSLTITSLADTSNGNFTIVRPTITVTSPNGGESWTIGTAQTILWTSSNLTGNVRIDLSIDGGATFPTSITTSTGNTGSFPWTVSGSATSTARIRIAGVGVPTAADTSNGNFTITGPTITVVSPNGGEAWGAGTQHTIQWSSSGVSGTVTIELSRNGGTTYETLFAGTANDGSEPWTVTNPATAQARVRITSVANPSVVDVSNGVFTITPSFFFLTDLIFSDNGGETDSMEFGTAVGATDSIDVLYGEVEQPPPPPVGVLDVRWQIAGTQGTKRDVRDTLGGTRQEIIYRGLIQPGPGGYPFVVRWHRPALPAGSFRLRDAYGGTFFQADMKQQDSVVITDAGVQAIQLIYDLGTSVTTTVQGGWNIVSLPVSVTDRRKVTVFPTANTSAFAYTPTGYATRDTLSYGEGYWLRFPSTQSVTVTGQPRTLDTLNVRQGWNIIGSVSGAVPVGNIIQIPGGLVLSSYFQYTSSGYTPAATINPMQGYWVKVNQDGRLVLSAPITGPAARHPGGR